MKQSQLNAYGNNEIANLSKRYLAKDPNYISSIDIIIFEWQKLKRYVAKDLKNLKIKREDLLIYILTNKDFEYGFKGILEIIEIYCALPCSNAEVERGFSTMNRIKTKERNRLLSQTLGSLMMLSLNGPPAEDWKNEDTNDYISYWHSNYNVKLGDHI